jgi:acyl-CoA synthetase (NDP forming)
MTGASLLQTLFEPRSIAVVGASGNAAKLGAQVFGRLATGFDGKLWAINPAQAEVAGRPTLPSVRALPEPVDLLVVLTPAAALVEAIEELPPGKVRNVVAISSGFAEAPGDGFALQDRLIKAARRAGARLIGPNVVGVLSPATGLNASIIPLMPPGGNPGVGVVTQSGGFGMALSMYACDSSMGVSRFCDVGNTADVAAAEIVEALAEDPATGVIAIFLESVPDFARFEAAVKAASARKPVLFCNVGRTPAGQAASLGHLGMTPHWEKAGPPKGAWHVSTGHDLLVAANAALWCRQRQAGRRVAIVTGTGGVGSELADLAHERGLVVPRFSDALQARLAELLPPYAALGNPVDLTPIWRDYPEVYPRIISAIEESGEVDLVAVSITDVPTTVPDLANSLGAFAGHGRKLPMLVFWASRDADIGNAAAMRRSRVPVYRTTRDLMNACAAVAGLGAPPA